MTCAERNERVGILRSELDLLMSGDSVYEERLTLPEEAPGRAARRRRLTAIFRELASIREECLKEQQPASDLVVCTVRSFFGDAICSAVGCGSGEMHSEECPMLKEDGGLKS
jgi:hypothetical protein